MREARITRLDLAELTSGNAAAVVRKLEAAGFVLISKACPIRIAEPWSCAGDPESGELVYYQAEDASEDARWSVSLSGAPRKPLGAEP